MYKILILDIDNTLNTFDPEQVIADAASVGYDQWSDYVQHKFRESINDISIPARTKFVQYYPLMKLYYDYVVVITGRRLKYSQQTEAWLNEHGFLYDEIIYRDDKCEDVSWVCKEEMFKCFLKKFLKYDNQEFYGRQPIYADDKARVHLDILDDEEKVLERYDRVVYELQNDPFNKMYHLFLLRYCIPRQTDTYLNNLIAVFRDKIGL